MVCIILLGTPPPPSAATPVQISFAYYFLAFFSLVFTDDMWQDGGWHQDADYASWWCGLLNAKIIFLPLVKIRLIVVGYQNNASTLPRSSSAEELLFYHFYPLWTLIGQRQQVHRDNKKMHSSISYIGDI